MDITAFTALALACAPMVHASTAHALVTVESSFNPHAIGVVGGSLKRQPNSRAEAVATAKQLQAKGWNFSVGLAQINVSNFARMGLTTQSAFERLGLSVATAFDPCANLAAMQTVLAECFARSAVKGSSQTALRQALSCYYSGNFVTGFKHGYVRRVTHAAYAVQRVAFRGGAPP
jgi:type IV secretion system protein VirB1